MTTEVETKQQVTQGTPAGNAKFWLDEIDRSGKREREWRKEAKEVIHRYRRETPQGKKSTKRGFNILWSNVELLKPAILSRTPQPDVRRRFLDENPVARVAAQIMERALKFTADDPEYDFTGTLEDARDDVTLPGRGTVRIVYEPEMVKREVDRVPAGLNEFGIPTGTAFSLDGAEVTPDGFDPPTVTNPEGAPFVEEVVKRDLYCQYIYWEDYREGDARVWEQVPWIAYRHFMNRDELVEQFGDVGKEVPVSRRTKAEKSGDEDEPETALSTGIVWEIWDKTERKRIWVAEGFNEKLLDVEADPYELENFFPQPAPIYAVGTNNTRVPVPEFRLYQAQADELDKISMRIEKLIDALKVRGIYASELSEMTDLLDGNENELIPVKNWAAVQDRGGLDGAISWIPIEQIAKVLAGLYQQREVIKVEIAELTGLSDILRGSTDPRETKGAQQIKANFGTVRLSPRQKPMETMIRDLFRIKAEIIAENFEAEELIKMTGFDLVKEAQDLEVDPNQLMDAVMQLFREEKTRSFNIDVETDSTVQPDEQAEQANVAEFMGVTTNFLETAGVAGASNPALIPLMFEIYKASARRFKMGRELEESIDEAAQATLNQLKQAQEQPQEDPEAEAVRAEIERENQKAVAQLQLQVQELQATMGLKQAELQGNMQLKEAEMANKIELQRRQAEQQPTQQ